MHLDIIISYPFSLAISIFVALFIFIFYATLKKVKPLPDYDNGIPVIEVVKTLEKVCPIGKENNWKLFPFDHGCHRCWTHSLSIPFLKSSINLCGSVTKVTSSSESVCSLIANVTKWPEWNPFFSSQYILKPFHNKTLRKDNFMEAKRIISIQSDVIIYRFHHISETKVGWILLWNPKKLEFFYFLTQPIENHKGEPVCLLTHIMGTDSNLSSSSISLISQRLRNIQEILTLSSLHLVPSHHSSQKESTPEEEYNLSSTNREYPSSLSSAKSCEKEASDTIFILVPFVKSTYQLWKTTIEYKLAVKSIESVSSQRKSPMVTNSKENVSDNENASKSLRRTVSDVDVNHKTFTYLSKPLSSNTDKSKDFLLPKKIINSELKAISNTSPKQKSESTSEDSDDKNTASVEKMHQKLKLRSLSETAVSKQTNWNSSFKSINSEKDCEKFAVLKDVNEIAEEKLLVLDEEDDKEEFHSSVSEDFEVVETSEFAGANCFSVFA